MKLIPMLFSTEMVQATIDLRKTNTRRTKGLDVPNKIPGHWTYAKVLQGNQLLYSGPQKIDPDALYACFGNSANDEWLQPIRCPYGKPGDIIWVRENFRITGSNSEDGEITFGYMVGDTRIMTEALEWEQIFKYAEQSQDDLIKAGYDMDGEGRFKNVDIKHLRVRPSIHMPKAAARIWLEITDIKCERLQGISAEDAIAEGILITRPLEGITYYKNYGDGNKCKDFLEEVTYGFNHGKEEHAAPVASFCTLWIEINGRESWIANPWVWVVKFKVLSTTGKPELV